MTVHPSNSIPYVFPEQEPIHLPVRAGSCVGQLQALRSEGLRPASMGEIMEQVVHAIDSQRCDLLGGWSASIDTGDSVLYRPSCGRRPPTIKVVSRSPSLSAIDYGAKLKPDYIENWAGSLILRHSAYEESDGTEFSHIDIERFANTALTRAEAESNPLWLALAGGDGALLRAYTKVLHSLFGDSGMMRFGVFTSGPHATLVERMVCFTGLDAKSNVSARNLGSLNSAARFVGVPVDINTFLAQINGDESEPRTGVEPRKTGAEAGAWTRVNQDLNKVA